MKSRKVRPIVEFTEVALEVFKQQASLREKSLSQYLGELILLGYQHSN